MYVFLILVFLSLGVALRIWRKKRILKAAGKYSIDPSSERGNELLSDFFSSSLNAASYLCIAIAFVFSLIELPRALGF